MKFKLCFVLGMLISVLCSAQGKFFGVHYGVSTNNVLGQQAVKTFSLRGEQWAAQYEYRSENKLGYAISLAYGSKGYSSKVIFTDDNGVPTGEELVLETNFTYLSVPIKTGFFLGRKLSGFGYAGLAPAFLLNAKQNEYVIGGSSELDISDKPEKFDLQVLLEVGMHYQPIKKFGLMASVQFDQSLLTFTKRGFFEDWKMRHSRALVQMGFTYKLREAQAKKPFVVY